MDMRRVYHRHDPGPAADTGLHRDYAYPIRVAGLVALSAIAGVIGAVGVEGLVQLAAVVVLPMVVIGYVGAALYETSD